MNLEYRLNCNQEILKIKELNTNMKFEMIARATVKALVVPFFLFSTSVALAIDPPKNPRAVVQSSTQIQWEWDWVSGADQFEVTVDGLYQGLTRDPRFNSQDLWPGEHSMSVKAVDQNGQYSGSSITVKVNTNNTDSSSAPVETSAPTDRSTATSSGAVAIPGNPQAQEVEQSTVQWKWDWTPGAAKYDVTVDGAYAGTTSDTQYFSQNLWAGEHSMTVRAINDAGQYSEPTSTVKINVQANFSGSTSVAPPPPQNDAAVTNVAPAPSSDNGPIDPASYNYSDAIQKPGYQLTFSDEFNASNLNSNRWNTQLRWDGEFNGERLEYRVINGENQFYVNTLTDNQEHKDLVASQHNPFELDGSRLAIRAIRNPLKTNNNKNGHGSLREMVSQQDFLSGSLSTYDKFTQRYGYFEARIKIPSHVGTFPAFWLHHQQRKYEGTRRTEIDIMENLGHAPWYVYNSFHYFNNVSETYGGDAVFVKPQPEGQIYDGTDFSQDYHTYAVEWEPGHVTWFIDGQKVSELYDSAVDYEDLYIIMNMAVGGFWTNYPASSGGLGRNSGDFFPTQNDLNNFSNPALEIDYVRVYKRN